MTQEEKDLLLKDLYGRMPYGVKVEYGIYVCEVLSVDIFNKELTIRICNGYCPNVKLEDVKPCLFPISSMTEEQCYDFYCRFVENEIDYDDFKKYYFDEGRWHKLLTSIDDCSRVIDWFHKNHFDYRGLIPKGLALDATGKNIY